MSYGYGVGGPSFEDYNDYEEPDYMTELTCPKCGHDSHNIPCEEWIADNKMCICPTPETPVANVVEARDARDYIEDFDSPDDNGFYSHQCAKCGKDFAGHKRRLGPCKACHLAELEAVMSSINAAAQSVGDVSTIKSWPTAFIVLANGPWSHVTEITTKDIQALASEVSRLREQLREAKEGATHNQIRSVNNDMTHEPTTTEIIEGAATALSGQWSESWIALLRSIGKQMTEKDDALEFIADHLESEMGLLSADDYSPEFGTNENIILAFNKAMEVQGCGRRVSLWTE